MRAGMTQNTSHAVMSQRSEPNDSLDDFPTPPWAARALCEKVIPVEDWGKSVWEPACNRGYLVKGLSDYFETVYQSDIHYYGQKHVGDFLFPCGEYQTDWIITNPPFRLAEQYKNRANQIANVGTAMLVRTQFLESVGRYERLFSKTQPSTIAQFSERVPMVKGRIDPAISTATSYCWLVWKKKNRRIDGGTDFIWIPPCRRQLEREGDYDQV